jgi:hypothetical protein
MEKCKIDFESLPWESPMPGIRFKAHKQNGKVLRLVEFSKDFVEPDWCRKGHIGYILQGEMEINFNGNLVVFRAGDGVFILSEDEEKHMGKVISDTMTAILIEEE